MPQGKLQVIQPAPPAPMRPARLSIRFLAYRNHPTTHSPANLKLWATYPTPGPRLMPPIRRREPQPAFVEKQQAHSLNQEPGIVTKVETPEGPGWPVALSSAALCPAGTSTTGRFAHSQQRGSLEGAEEAQELQEGGEVQASVRHCQRKLHGFMHATLLPAAGGFLVRLPRYENS